MRLYLAGPLFTTAELEFNSRLAAHLRDHGYDVWLPQEHEQRRSSARAIFLTDVKGIDWADVVVANMDGPDPDSGTCWECGYAYRKKPIIVFRSDFRVGEEIDKGPYNLMLTQSATECLNLSFASTEHIATMIDEALRRLGESTPATDSLIICKSCEEACSLRPLRNICKCQYVRANARLAAGTQASSNSDLARCSA